MNTSYNESFGTFDEAQYYMETILMGHKSFYLREAKLFLVNNRWNVSVIVEDVQTELELEFDV